MIILKTLGKRIKRLRENLKDEDSKWTQNYVAKQIGVARVTYTAYENGTKTPPPDIVKKLANLFNVSTDYLLGNTDDPYEIEDEELEEFIKNVRVWYKDAPKTKEEKLKLMKDMFELIKKYEQK